MTVAKDLIRMASLAILIVGASTMLLGTRTAFAGDTEADCGPSDNDACATPSSWYEDKKCVPSGGGENLLDAGCETCTEAAGWVCITEWGDIEEYKHKTSSE